MSRVHAVLGDYYHASDQLVVLVRSLGLDEHELTIARYPDRFEPASLVGHDLLILAAIGKLAPRVSDDQWLDTDAQSALADHIAAGNGLLVVHSGTASHPEDGPFRATVGGHFLRHPPEHPLVTITPVAEHPITRGVEPFAHEDEHYFVDVDPDVTQLLEATSTLGHTSAGWCAQRGDGRVAAIIPGHTRQMLEDARLTTLVRNAARWCLGEIG